MVVARQCRGRLLKTVALLEGCGEAVARQWEGWTGMRRQSVVRWCGHCLGKRAERQWSDSGPALVWECSQGEARLRGSGEAPRVPGECARESAPGECALGECARGSVPGECASARVTEECCVLGECLRVCPARGVCEGSERVQGLEPRNSLYGAL